MVACCLGCEVDVDDGGGQVPRGLRAHTQAEGDRHSAIKGIMGFILYLPEHLTIIFVE